MARHAFKKSIASPRFAFPLPTITSLHRFRCDLGEILGARRRRLEYVASKAESSFQIAFAELRTEECRVVASASTAMQFSAQGFPDGIICIPFSGSSLTRSNGAWIEWGSGRDAIYLPRGDAKGESSARSVIGIDVDPSRLEAIARAMAGSDREEDDRIIDFDAPRPLSLIWGDVNFSILFQQFSAMIDAMGADPERVERSGLPEMISSRIRDGLSPVATLAAARGRSSNRRQSRRKSPL